MKVKMDLDTVIRDVMLQISNEDDRKMFADWLTSNPNRQEIIEVEVLTSRLSLPQESNVYEQEIVNLLRDLQHEQVQEILDFALFIAARHGHVTGSSSPIEQLQSGQHARKTESQKAVDQPSDKETNHWGYGILKIIILIMPFVGLLLGFLVVASLNR